MNQEDETHFPPLYHQHHLEYQEDMQFWVDLATQYGSPLLELGCGTGRLLLPLAEAGFQCYGIDNDQRMLEFLQNRIPNELLDGIRTFNSDFTAFSLDILFPLIILPCNTYSTLRTDLRQSLLMCVHKHLTANGIFVVSMPNPELLSNQEYSQDSEIENTFPHPETGDPVQVSYRIERSVDTVAFYWFYDQLLPDGKVHRTTVCTNHSLIPSSQYMDEIENSGFEIIETFGSFGRTAFSPDSPHLILITRKF